MMEEDEERYTEDPQVPSSLNLPLLSRDDETWEKFGADIVADAALRGEWKDDNTRALLWRLLLGVIPRGTPPSAWATEMSNKRAQHRELVAEHRVDIVNMSANPLFPGSGSGDDDPWSHFYERKEMTDTIKADLERLFPTGCGDHFLAPQRQALLLNVLSLWADLNTETAYRQGMHEVLAPLILALEKEAAAASRVEAVGDKSAAVVEEGGGQAAAGTRGTSSWLGKSMVNGAPMDTASHPGAAAILGVGSTPEDLEADAFWLFSAVMKGLEAFYEHGNKAPSSSSSSSSSSSARRPGPGAGAGPRMRGPQMGAGRGRGRGGGGDGGGVDSPVVEMCKRLQGPRMREADPELQKHLAVLDISPQLYGMKWARLMFGREFRVESVLLLWDHIFASFWIEGRPDVPECIENVALAMVLSIRDELLAEDCTGCLQLLMRYPPDQSVSSVISLSLNPGQMLASQRSPLSHSSADLAFGGGDVSSHSPLGGGGGDHSATSSWLNGPGRDAGGIVSSRSPPAPNSSILAGRAPEYGRGSYSGSVSGGAGGGLRDGRRGGGLETGLRGAGRDPRFGTDREAKNHWQQGLDDFTRRAISAAQGVAKLAVQTVERTQAGGGEDMRQQRGPQALPVAEALSLARRLRAACAAMETGETSVNLAAQEIKEVARLLEVRSGSTPGGSGSGYHYAGREPVRTNYASGAGAASSSSNSMRGGGGQTVQPNSRGSSNNSLGGGGGGQAVTRGFSTYAEDDGCADALYTQDL